MPYNSLVEAMMQGWWVGPHFPHSGSQDKPALPDGLQAYQSIHALFADAPACARGATEPELLAEINRVTMERGGPWKV